MTKPRREDYTLIDAGAEFSPDRVYRFRLWRRWAPGPMLMVIGLNPSTADETVNDPTIRRCLDYAQQWGFSGLEMLNIFAFRATDPAEMLRAGDPVWPENLRTIEKVARATMAEGGAILAAWGNHGQHRHRSNDVRQTLSRCDVACLGRNANGEPKHPLYLRRDTVPVWFLGNGGRLVMTPMEEGTT